METSETLFISIIVPVRNGGKLLVSCLRSLNDLDYSKDKYEVILADGLSTDGSRKIGKKYGAKVVINRGLTVVSGRNKGFEASKGELVVFTDADCVADKNWLKNCLKYFKDEEVACVGGPNLTPKDETAFGRAVGFIFNQPLFAAGSIHARVLKEVREVKSIPGCNAIYRRSVLEKVMPVDEKLVEAEDTEMNRDIRRLGYKLFYTPDTIVWHYRRPTPQKLFYQMFRYALGRARLGKRDIKMLNLTYVGVGFLVPILLLLLLISYWIGWYCFLIFFLLFLIGCLIYSMKASVEQRSLRVALNVPLVISIIAFAWSTGFVKGLVLPKDYMSIRKTEK